MTDSESSENTIRVADFVGHALARLGVGHCFGVVGSGNFAVTNALRAAGVPFTAARHENGAASMADAWSRMSGRVGALSVHQGCGLTNAMTGIAEAAKSRTAMLVLAAEAAGAAVTSNFAVDQPALARSVGAVPDRVHGAGSVLADVVRAYRTAVTGRRTVVLNLPLDVQALSVSRSLLDRIPDVAPPIPPRPGAAAIAELADLIQRAQRPVIVAGRGARGAGPQLRALAEAAGALLATSAVANGLFAGEPFALGISGGFSSPLAAELIRDADLILGFGCALNMWTMRHGSLIGRDTTVVQIDDDPSALGAHRTITLGVLGDTAATAMDLTAALSTDAVRVRYRTDQVRDRLVRSGRWNDVDTPDLSTADTIDPRVLSARLDELLPAERIVSIDSGNFMGYPSAYLRVPDENGFCFTQAFQSIGLGLGTAIGAALARPDRLPVLGTGDGGFLMAIAELETAVRMQLPLLVVVYNDAAYGAEVHHFGPADPNADLTTVTFRDSDIGSLARGFGADGLTVRVPDDLAGVSGWLAGAPSRPLVVDAKIASDGGSWWLQEAFAGH